MNDPGVPKPLPSFAKATRVLPAFTPQPNYGVFGEGE